MIFEILKDFIEELDGISAKPYFRIPKPNPYFPKNFSIEKNFDHLDDTSKKPNRVVNKEELEIWHHQDTRFNQPKTHVELIIRNPAFFGSLRTCMKTKLFVEMLMDQFPPFLYPATLAGIIWHLEFEYRPYDAGIVITVFGYSDSIPHVMNKIAELIESFEPTPTRFEQLKERMIKKTENFDTFEAKDMLYHERFNFTIDGYHTLNDKINALKSVTFRQFKAYLRDNLVGSKVIALIAGNIRRSPAIKTVENFVKRARITGPYSDADRYANFRVVELEPGANLGMG